jgi:putative tricarboxylic transport membrane protein
VETLAGFGYGFAHALSGWNPVYALAGALLGTAVGVLPGLGAPATIALLLPVTYRMDPTAAIILMAGVFSGAMYGGSTTAILLKVPGESAAIVTCFDGYPLARQGRAGAALAVAALASFAGGSMSVLALSAIAPTLAAGALRFGPPERASLVLLGLAATVTLSGDSRLKGLMMMALGLVLGSIGLDPVSGVARFTFGSSWLADGLDVVVVGMGLFGIAEVLGHLADPAAAAQPIRFRTLWPSRDDWRRSVTAIVRGAGIGFLIGMVPGGSATVGSFAAYGVEKHLAREPGRFGHGAIEGVAAPEAANNAASTASFIPLLTLGIPGNAATAMIFSALLVHGIQPGPLLATEHPELFWGVIASMYLGHIALLALNLPLVGLWVRLLHIRYAYLLTLIAVLCTIGAYSLRLSIADVYLMVALGFAGYALRLMEFPVPPLVIAMILGRLAERSFVQSLQMSGGDPGIFVERPVSACLLAMTVAFVAVPVVSRRWPGRTAGT